MQRPKSNRRSRQQQHVQRAASALSEFRREFGRDPSNVELAGLTGIGQYTIDRIWLAVEETIRKTQGLTHALCD